MKAYHISFIYDQPQPGVITIPAETPEDATAKLNEMLVGYTNVKIMQVVDLEEVPFMQLMFNRQQEQAESMEEDMSDDEAEYSAEIVEFKKPN